VPIGDENPAMPTIHEFVVTPRRGRERRPGLLGPFSSPSRPLNFHEIPPTATCKIGHKRTLASDHHWQLAPKKC
jgi:hypothetical protein